MSTQTLENADGVYTASYCHRDCILYALSIGFGSSDVEFTEDLLFVNERHPRFKVAPTFALSALFWATKQSTWPGELPDFPPPLMKEMGVLPPESLKNPAALDGLPILHTWQSLELLHTLSPPSKMGTIGRWDVKGKFCGVCILQGFGFFCGGFCSTARGK